MPQDIKLWKIVNKSELEKIPQEKVGLEKKLEDWVEDDVSLISDDLLLIGRQVTTDLGGSIDLLCLDSKGDIVVIELKRDKTPKDVVAQILNYAAWASNLSHEEITELAEDYIEDQSLEQAFAEKFEEETPEVLNENHKGLIVASKVDARTERVVQYLSDSYGVGINVATFRFFKENGDRYLSRVFFIEPSEAERRSERRAGSKRKPPLTFEELENIARENRVDDLYKRLTGKLENFFDYSGRTRSSITFIGVMGEEDSRKTIFSVLPGESSKDKGLKYQVYTNRFINYFNIPKETCRELLPHYQVRDHKDSGRERGESYFKNMEEVEDFLAKLKSLIK